ncbi:MAG: hypothetical protein GY705_09150 [Bacteroidetes bacterium]|nr:hypothetical protein [Bacteroidota bacterium]
MTFRFKNIRLLFSLFILTFSGCYSFKGISIPPEVNTFYVAEFDNKANNVVPTLAQTITEALKSKIRTESRLIWNETEPDVEFQGSIVDYRITAEAPQPGEYSGVNRLTIILSVEYINSTNEEDTWKSNFSYFYDFPADTDLISIQDEAIDAINEQLLEDIFNKAFTSW